MTTTPPCDSKTKLFRAVAGALLAAAALCVAPACELIAQVDRSQIGDGGSTCSTLGCQNGASCEEDAGTARCVCKEGYEGDACERPSSEQCTADTCRNGGTCSVVDGKARCECVEGYTGDDCGTDIDDCAAGPCQNGGTCSDLVNAFQCECAPGYSGDRCEVDVNDCASNPCQNGGACTDGVNTFTCACTGGFSGPTCAVQTDECQSNPCLNGGVCTDGANSFTCQCSGIYAGPTCSSLLANFSTIAGTNETTFGGLSVARALEFAISAPLSARSISVTGLPVGKESTTRMWIKTGGIDLMVTDTYALGTPYTPTSTGAGTATFTFATPKPFTANTYGVVLSVDDGDWSVRQYNNSGQSMSVASTTFGSVFGWYGDVDRATNVVSTVSLYDNSFFRIPNIAITFDP